MASEILHGIQEVPKPTTPIKRVEKYWGFMDTLHDDDSVTVKRIFMRAKTQSSLEYHVKKTESYYVERGTLKVGVRYARAKNAIVVLYPGDVFHIPPGLMHMRIAEEDCVIIETSSKDDDLDSHIVEDGTTYVHVVSP